MRAEDDRLAENRRLENVVAAVVDEASADEHGGRQLIELRELAERVEHDDVGAGFRVDRQVGPPRDGTKPASRARRSTSPKRSGWRGARITIARRLRRLHAGERAEHGRFLAAERAAGDNHDAARREPEEPQHAFARLAVRDRRRPLERIELEAAGDGHAQGVGAELDQPPRRFLALHAEAIDVGEHAAEERADRGGSADTSATRCGR